MSLAAVEAELRSRFMVVHPEWTPACVDYISAAYTETARIQNNRQQLTIPYDQLLNEVLSQYLHGDLCEIGLPTLPPNVLASCHNVTLQNVVLQIVDVMEVGESVMSLYNTLRDEMGRRMIPTEFPTNSVVSRSRRRNNNNNNNNNNSGKVKFPRKMLQIVFTDGHQQVEGMEYKTLPMFDLYTPPGTKVLIKKAKILRGVLLLEPQNIQVLAYAEVESTYEHDMIRVLERKFKTLLNMPLDEDTLLPLPPPPPDDGNEGIVRPYNHVNELPPPPDPPRQPLQQIPPPNPPQRPPVKQETNNNYRNNQNNNNVLVDEFDDVDDFIDPEILEQLDFDVVLSPLSQPQQLQPRMPQQAQRNTQLLQPPPPRTHNNAINNNISNNHDSSFAFDDFDDIDYAALVEDPDVLDILDQGNVSTTNNATPATKKRKSSQPIVKPEPPAQQPDEPEFNEEELQEFGLSFVAARKRSKPFKLQGLKGTSSESGESDIEDLDEMLAGMAGKKQKKNEQKIAIKSKKQAIDLCDDDEDELPALPAKKIKSVLKGLSSSTTTSSSPLPMLAGARRKAMKEKLPFSEEKEEPMKPVELSTSQANAISVKDLQRRFLSTPTSSSASSSLSSTSSTTLSPIWIKCKLVSFSKLRFDPFQGFSMGLLVADSNDDIFGGGQWDLEDLAVNAERDGIVGLYVGNEVCIFHLLN